MDLQKKTKEFLAENLINFIDENPDKHWDWFSISCNPNITMKIIKENPDKSWNWSGISRNKFIKEKEIIFNKLKQKQAASIIQKNFRKFRYDPKYPFCKRVLLNNLKDIGVDI